MHNLIGQTFGRLTVLKLWRIRTRRYWKCSCICGKITVVETYKLRSGQTKSCGCLAQEVRGQHAITHGGTRGPRNNWDPRVKMFHAAKARAKKFSLRFDIEIADLVIPEHCPVLGIKLMSNLKQCQDNSPSLDRVIPERGYIRGNVRVISHKANTIKNNATTDELRKVLEYLESNQR